MKWPPKPTTILAYIAIIATVAAAVSGFAAIRQGRDNAKRIDDIEAVQAKLCDAMTTMSEGIISNHQHSIDQSKAFIASGVYFKFFPQIPKEQLVRLTRRQNKHDQREIDATAAGVKKACG